MRVLLDTNVVIWWLASYGRLGADVTEVINDGDVEVYVSAVTAAEIATRTLIGTLKVPGDLPFQMKANAFKELPVSIEHGIEVGRLPLHHRDPFDRLLIAQARCEGLVLITADRKISYYDVRVLSAN